MEAFRRLASLPPYVFNITGEMKAEARRRGEDIIDFGMGNPDGATPPHIVDKLIEAAQKPVPRIATRSPRAFRGCARPSATGTSALRRRPRPRLRGHRHHRLEGGHRPPLPRHPRLARHRARAQSQLPHPHLRPGHRRRARVSVRRDERSRRLPRRARSTICRACVRGRRCFILNFPANPTTQTRRAAVSSSASSRFCRAEHGSIFIHDLAYADLVFDGYRAPCVLQVPGAKDIAVEFFTLSKSYNMPGWRVGFMVGNPVLVDALARIKSYFDYGTFTPIQVASILALEGPQDCVARNLRHLPQAAATCWCEGLNHIGWPVEMPEGNDVRVGQNPGAYRRSARWNSPRSCCARRRSPSAPASASATTATATCASP